MISSLLAAANPTDHVVDTKIFGIGADHGFWLISNHMIMLITSAVIMLLIFPWLTRHYRDGQLVPTGTRNFFEALMMFIRNDVVKPLLGEATDRFMPLMWTLFFFILITNLLGLIPFDAIQKLIFGEAIYPIYGTATSNFWVTATLAIIVFCVIQFNGIQAQGVKGWLHHFLGGAPWWLFPIMVPVEILGMLIKPFALAVRLAANMTAGHVLLAVLISFGPVAINAAGWGVGGGVTLISVIASVAILMLELFVACLQAYLFTFLSALFISQLLQHHHDEHQEEEAEGHKLGETHAVRERDAVKAHQKLHPAH